MPRWMHTMLVLIFIGASTVSCGEPGMKLVWADEFNEAGMPDTTKWGYEVGNVRNREWQYYTYARPENVQVADGMLTITARKDDGFQFSRYTSASLTTRETFQFTYGKVVVRAKIPTGRGTWPAIWMLGKNIEQVGWPTCGEIDIMENVGFDPQRLHFTIHTEKFNHMAGTQSTGTILAEAPWNDFHEYAMTWTKDRIEFFFDGQKTHEFVNNGGGVEAWPFDAPMFLILNLAIGGTWGGQQGVDDGIFPAAFQIDYVRVYQ